MVFYSRNSHTSLPFARSSPINIITAKSRLHSGNGGRGPLQSLCGSSDRRQLKSATDRNISTLMLPILTPHAQHADRQGLHTWLRNSNWQKHTTAMPANPTSTLKQLCDNHGFMGGTLHLAFRPLLPRQIQLNMQTVAPRSRPVRGHVSQRSVYTILYIPAVYQGLHIGQATRLVPPLRGKLQCKHADSPHPEHSPDPGSTAGQRKTTGQATASTHTL
jgi:hypothetical protein